MNLSLRFNGEYHRLILVENNDQIHLPFFFEEVTLPKRTGDADKSAGNRNKTTAQYTPCPRKTEGHPTLAVQRRPSSRHARIGTPWNSGTTTGQAAHHYGVSLFSQGIPAPTPSDPLITGTEPGTKHGAGNAIDGGRIYFTTNALNQKDLDASPQSKARQGLTYVTDMRPDTEGVNRDECANSVLIYYTIHGDSSEEECRSELTQVPEDGQGSAVQNNVPPVHGDKKDAPSNELVEAHLVRKPYDGVNPSTSTLINSCTAITEPSDAHSMEDSEDGRRTYFTIHGDSDKKDELDSPEPAVADDQNPAMPGNSAHVSDDTDTPPLTAIPGTPRKPVDTDLLPNPFARLP